MLPTPPPPLFRPIYLDHNATTPLDPDVLRVMMPYFVEKFGNPSSVEHAYGTEAAEAVEGAREQVAFFIGARSSEIVFTGSCTEANHLALFGYARAEPTRRHFITSAIEHPAVLESFRALEQDGHQVTYLPVDEQGRVDPQSVRRAITGNSALVSIMAANNEVGTLQPLRAIGAICREHNVLFHSDLAQIAAHQPVNVDDLGLHLASLSAHKAYGPKGVGALYIRSRRPRVRLAPVLYGGGQERALRPGTLNTPLIVGMGEALTKTRRVMASETVRLRSLCDAFRIKFHAAVPDACLNGHPEDRLPSNLSFSVPGLEPLALIRVLRDQVCFSASSACATDAMKTSPVLLAMHGDGWRARNAFRLAPGRFTSDDEWWRAFDRILDQVGRLRRAVA